MNIKYCLINNQTICEKNCEKPCLLAEKYYIRDIETNEEYECINSEGQILTTIFSNKIISINKVFNSCLLRADFLDENVEQINSVCKNIINGQYYVGNKFINDIQVK